MLQKQKERAERRLQKQKDRNAQLKQQHALKRKQKGLKQIRKELWKYTSLIVRHGATQCFTCGKVKKLSAGHFWSKGGHPATAFDFANLRPQCDGCNLFNHGALADYAVRLRAEIGDEAFEELNKRAHSGHKWNRADLEDMLAKRKQFVEENY